MGLWVGVSCGHGSGLDAWGSFRSGVVDFFSFLRRAAVPVIRGYEL